MKLVPQVSRHAWRAAVVAPCAALAFAGCSAANVGGDDTDHESALGANVIRAAASTALGAHYDATQANITFNVFSSAATRIELDLYASPTAATEAMSVLLTANATTHVWSQTVSVASLKAAGISGAVYYGYRAWGPNWPFNASFTRGSGVGFVADVDAQGNRFNPNKLLFDPYAVEISHDPNNPSNSDGGVFASGAANRNRDSGPLAPKGIVLPPGAASLGTKPTRALKDDVIYEVNLRGLTKQDPSITSCQGTYAAAGQKALALAALGVTAVEFLPVQETQNDTNDVAPTDTTGDNYWGYMTLNYFSPDRRYACDKTPGGPTREWQGMAKAFHDAGLKVFIDVVYNHTGEGGAWTAGDSSTFSVLSFRGLDNPTYYSLTADKQLNWDNTGVGGNYNTFNPTAQNLIVDSLAYWRDTLGVDGFRFDLASVLGNTCQHGCFNYDKTNPGTALNRIARDLSPRPAAGGAGTDYVAEPWAIGGNSYQVGNFPSGWSEWNGIFRDSLRADQNQLGVAAVTPGELATRFAGSSDLFQDDGRLPGNSVNIMVVHDGFTLKDLYSCNTKNNNQAWPFGPSNGGEDNNRSWDQSGVAADQRKAARNGMSFLMLSAGVPLFTGGDEFLRTQACNNNAYNLDSNANWLNYSWTTDQTNFRAFTQRLVAFRKAHPALRPSGFYSASDTNGNVMEQLRWFRPDGSVPDSTYFNDANQQSLAFRLDGTEFGDTASAIYVAYNGGTDPVTFSLPWPGNNKTWYRVTDTCPWAEGPNQVRAPGQEDLLAGEGSTYGLCGRGRLLLIAK